MTKHTPGPWAVNTVGPHWNNPDINMIEINHGNDGECVCDTVYEMSDAKLIAAAPEMLELLHRASCAIRSIPFCDASAYEACDKIDELINKIEGDS